MKETKFIQRSFGLPIDKTKVQLLIFSMLFVLFSSFANAEPKTDQQREISGIVKDSDGIPLEGVTVLINQFERGTATDANGKYSISAKTGDKILFTYVGFENKEFVIGDKNTINVTMEDDVSLLDEIVLIGYGKQQRSKVSAAISTIEGQDIQNEIQSGASFDRALSGVVQGVRVIQGGGRPGTGVDINIRGYTSPFADSANNPLFIIDDVPIQATKGFTGNNNPLASINPNDIESINVLKDAAATSIYGSRGANGVIIIKTKKGSIDQAMQVNLSTKSTFSRPINTLKYLDANGYKNYVGIIMKNLEETGGLLPSYTEFGAVFDPATYTLAYDPSQANFRKANTNWSDVVYRKAAYTQEYNASVLGGTEKSVYGLSLRYLNQEGLLKKDEFKQYNARFNFSIKPNDKWDIGTDISLGTTINKTGYISQNPNLNQALSKRPDLAIYDEKGNFTTYQASRFGQNFNYANPLAFTTQNFGNTKGRSVTGNVYVQHEILNGLKLKAALNVGHFQSNINNFSSGEFSPDGYLSNKLNESRILNLIDASDTNFVTDFTANYKKTINQKHSLDLLAGFTKTREYSENIKNTYSNFSNNLLRLPQYAKLNYKPLSEPGISGLNSYIGRASYDYDNRYDITATVRLDRTSKFVPSNRDAWFPSVAASWNIHNEKFITNKDNINKLKLRLSYGRTGSTNVPSFSFIQQFTAGALYNGEIAIGPSLTLADDTAGWEKTTEINAGLDFTFIKNRISGSVDFYNRRTDGVLISSPYPLETGAGSVTSNFATVNNRGFELGLNFNVLRSENFNWSLGVNATKNINKLVDFDGDFVSEGFDDSYEVGKEINLIKGYVVEGIYQTPDEINKLNTIAKSKNYPYYHSETTSPGDYKMKDVNGDGTITSEDRVILGSSQPDLFGGFRTQFRYKNFSLGTSFNYSFGAEIVRPLANANPYTNIETQFAPEYRWSTSNTKATLPRIATNADNSRISTANVFDASYVRLKSVRFDYSLPFSLIENLKLSNVKFYLSGNNLHTWTKFPGLDPESRLLGGAYSASTLNRDPYPIAKSFTFGVDVQF